MTSDELAAVGVLSTGEEIHESGNVQTRENDPAPDIAPDSGNREDGEIISEDKSGAEEDLGDVVADPRELVAARCSRSFPPSFVLVNLRSLRI
jgi:hypothetical protein